MPGLPRAVPSSYPLAVPQYAHYLSREAPPGVRSLARSPKDQPAAPASLSVGPGLVGDDLRLLTGGDGLELEEGVAGRDVLLVLDEDHPHARSRR